MSGHFCCHISTFTEICWSWEAASETWVIYWPQNRPLNPRHAVQDLVRIEEYRRFEFFLILVAMSYWYICCLGPVETFQFVTRRLDYHSYVYLRIDHLRATSISHWRWIFRPLSWVFQFQQMFCRSEKYSWRFQC